MEQDPQLNIQPRISPLGWYVVLDEPAESLIRMQGQVLESAPPEVLAALAQAYLRLFQRAPLVQLLDRLRQEEPHFGDLAEALRADDLLRRGEYRRAHALFCSLARVVGPYGAWAALRAAEALERLGHPGEAERLLVETRPRKEHEPLLLRPMVTARLHFRRGQLARAVQCLEGARNLTEQAPQPLVPAYHRTLAIYLTLLDDVPRALLHHRLALDGFVRLGDRFMLTHEYLSLGQTYLGTGELDHADFFFRKAASVVEDLDHPQLEALLNSRQGMLALIRGDLPRAREQFERDLQLCEQQQFLHGQAYARRNLGKVLVRQGEADQGVELINRSLADFEACQDLLNQELSRLEQASALLAIHGAGRADDVRHRLDLVTRFFVEQDRQELAAQVGAVRARLLVEEGTLELARQQMHNTARTLLAFGRPDRVIESLLSLAQTLMQRRQQEEAVYYLAWAYREAVKASRPRMASTVLDRLGEIDEQALMALVDEPPLPGLTPSPLSQKQFEQFLLSSRAPNFLRALERSSAVAPTEETVLIQGDTGTGKEMIARYIHSRGGRSRNTFLPVNCGAIPDGLVESEFFGHERGSFSGAVERRVGVFEAADGGVVFLDEVGELSPHGQVCLLRFMEDRQVRPVGASKTHKVNVRIICATNDDLLQRARQGTFRHDLYYRLAVFPVRVPPLREREKDMPELAEFLLRHNPLAQERRISSISPAAMKQLRAHHWPGNLRELDNAIRAAAINCQGDRLLKRDLPEFLTIDATERGPFPTLAEATRRHITEALRRSRGHKGRAAELLGIHRNTLTARLRNL